MKIRLLLLFVPIIIIAAFLSCATPVPPTGGPPDTTAPVVESTEPENETVNFDGRELRITFSKFINRGSLLNAIEIEPDLAITYEVRWRRKTAIIEFDRDLPENTTVIVKIGTDLQDMNNNELTSQFNFAISTGPEIDDGQAVASVRRSSDGEVDSGFRVFLYREPFDLSARANYVAQTDTSGRVQFGYLSEDTYMAIWVDDGNRNRIWDRGREAAQPFHDSTFTMEKGGEIDLGTIYVDSPDTTNPQLEGVGLLTENMLRLRFNEEVFWDDNSAIHINDTLGNRYTQAWPLYVLPDDPLILMAESVESLPEDETFSMEFDGLYDETGNSAEINVDSFVGSAQPDTIGLKIIGDNIIPGLFPDEPLIIGYNKLIDDTDVVDSLRVVEGDRMVQEWPETEVERHRLIIYPEEVWESGINYQFLIWNPHSEELRPLEPNIWQRNQLGAIEFVIADTSSTDEHFLTLYDDEGKIRIDTTFVQSLEIDELPPLSYTAIVFRDENGSGRWDRGSIIPFEAPEPYFVRIGVPVREGFTSELEIVFENEP